MPISNGKYVAPTWANNAPPPIDAAELNAISQSLANNYSRDEILSEETKTDLGLSSDATPNDAWTKIIPAGSVFWYAKDGIPNGFLKCDGSQISRTLYADLFSVIGTVFGTGDGSTTFALPNLMAAFIRSSGSYGSYSAKFGQKQEATTIILNTYSGQAMVSLRNPFILNQDAINGAGTINTNFQTQSSLSPLPVSGYYVRPYNVALTPIIKY